MFVAIAGMFLGTTVMFVVTTVLFLGATLVFTGGTAMFAGGTVMFTRVTVMSVAATVMFVMADATPAFLGARRLCTRENAVFVRKSRFLLENHTRVHMCHVAKTDDVKRVSKVAPQISKRFISKL